MLTSSSAIAALFGRLRTVTTSSAMSSGGIISARSTSWTSAVISVATKLRQIAVAVLPAEPAYRMGQCHQRELAHGIAGVVVLHPLARERGDIDDAAHAGLLEMGQRGADDAERCLHVHQPHVVERVLALLLDRR